MGDIAAQPIDREPLQEDILARVAAIQGADADAGALGDGSDGGRRYWLTGTARSAAQIYYENTHSADWTPPAPSPVPTGVAVFANDVALRHYAEQGNTIVHWSDFAVGGHFAAMETPDLLVEDVRAFFRPLR